MNSIFFIIVLFLILFNLVRPVEFAKLLRIDIDIFRIKKLNYKYTIQVKIGLFWFNIYQHYYHKDKVVLYIDDYQHFISNNYFDFDIIIIDKDIYNSKLFEIREYIKKQINR